MCTNWIPVFDIVASSVPRVTLAVAVAAWFVAVGVTILRQRIRIGRAEALRAVVLLVVVGTVAGGMYWLDVKRFHRALERAQEEGIPISGVVADFSPERYQGHGPEEQFRVNGYLFHYSYYFDTPFFNRSAAHGGPLRNGLKVRITAVGHHIARLEVCDDGGTTVSR